jgi:stage III sporulation protein AF
VETIYLEKVKILIEWIKNWVINICAAVIFITAVELIIPENKMDKYVKFVMGLILIAVIMNPIVKVLSSKGDMANYINRATNYVNSTSINSNIQQEKASDRDNTISEFKTNLQNTCAKMLKEKFPENNYEVTADVKYTSQEQEISIEDLKIHVKTSGVEKIRKVSIDAKISNTDDGIYSNDKTAVDIKNYLNDELKIDKNNIFVKEDNK